MRAALDPRAAPGAAGEAAVGGYTAYRKGTIALPLAERWKVAQDCRRGRNARREGYAEQILAGELWGPDGAARSYWHLLATRKPEPLPGRRGRWKAIESDRAWWWGWQDWGPAPTTEDRVAFHTRCDR
jgi:hypothetical protein